jgi:uncharacterized protein
MAAPKRHQPAPSDHATPRERLSHLERILGGYQRLLVAYSGGVDSAFLLQVAVDTLGDTRVLAVLGDSESLPRREREQAVELAARIGAPLRLLRTREIDDPDYARNPLNRCYFCKSELYDQLRQIVAAEGFDAIADGTNADDAGDFRPGRRAAQERGVISPLLEAGLHKEAIRSLSRERGLPTWDKPAMPCLASRIPFGEAVDPEKLRQVERAEEALQDCGIRGGRVRHHGQIARLEVPEAALATLTDPQQRRRLVEGVRAAGFLYVAVDLEGYRRGRLHETRTRNGDSFSG